MSNAVATFLPYLSQSFVSTVSRVSSAPPKVGFPVYYLTHRIEEIAIEGAVMQSDPIVDADAFFSSAEWMAGEARATAQVAGPVFDSVEDFLASLPD